MNIIVRDKTYEELTDFELGQLSPQNKVLLEEIERSIKVCLIKEESSESWQSTFGYLTENGEKVGVVFVMDEYDDYAMAHELLHIKSSLHIDNRALCKILFDAADRDEKLRCIFSEELVDRINNNADHLLIFPEYCNMGLPADRFFQDSVQQERATTEIAKKAIANKKPGDVLSALMMILFHPQKEKWSMELKQLKKIDSDLYKACNDFSNRVSDSINNQNRQNALERAYTSFAKSIQMWLTKIWKKP